MKLCSWRVPLLLSALNVTMKCLLLPAYRSTDFEVHRNWLAITYSLPIELWYFDATSVWTLDYPPFFAYFQWCLAQLAVRVDPGMVAVGNLGYASDSTVLFLRLSVIAVDTLLLVSAWLLLSAATPPRPHADRIRVFLLSAFGAGLLLVDHVHFQFNGMLLGLLTLCLHFAATGRALRLAAAFSALVLLKHLFVPLAPVVAAHLIATHCFVAPAARSGAPSDAPRKVFSILRLAQLGGVAAAALVFAFGPFLWRSGGLDQLKQIVSRLFPFGRGLVHAYWAPNVWALYCAVDKVGGQLLGLRAAGAGSSLLLLLLPENNSASGIVGDFAFLLLPRVPAALCLLLMAASLLPAVWAVWRRPRADVLARSLVYASLSSFMLGYHVHEKAALVPLLLQTLLALDSQSSRLLFLLLSGAVTAGLFPLFECRPELLVKGSLLAAYLSAGWQCCAADERSGLTVAGKRLLTVCWGSLLALFVFTEVLHPLLFRRSSDGQAVLPFLPLMLTSVVCATQLLVAWALSLRALLPSADAELK